MRFKEYEAERLQNIHPNFAEKSRKALDICDGLLGEGLYTADRLKEICECENHYFYIIRQGKDIIGIFYCYADRFDATELFGELQTPEILPDMRIGIGQSIAIQRSSDGAAFPNGCWNAALKCCLKQKVLMPFLFLAWVKGGNIPAHRHLEKCSYRLLQIIKQPGIQQNLKMSCLQYYTLQL